MASTTWQASATYVTSFVKAADALGHLKAVKLRLEPASLEMVQHPGLRAWWPGTQLVTVLEAVEATAGREAAREASIRGSRERMGPLVRPLASVVLSLSKQPMVALLSRLKNFVSAGVIGVESNFVAHPGRTGGVVTFTFPEPVPAVVSVLWHGMFDVGFTLARGGKVVNEKVTATEHRFELEW